MSPPNTPNRESCKRLDGPNPGPESTRDQRLGAPHQSAPTVVNGLQQSSRRPGPASQSRGRDAVITSTAPVPESRSAPTSSLAGPREASPPPSYHAASGEDTHPLTSPPPYRAFDYDNAEPISSLLSNGSLDVADFPRDASPTSAISQQGGPSEEIRAAPITWVEDQAALANSAGPSTSSLPEPDAQVRDPIDPNAVIATLPPLERTGPRVTFANRGSTLMPQNSRMAQFIAYIGQRTGLFAQTSRHPTGINVPFASEVDPARILYLRDRTGSINDDLLARMRGWYGMMGESRRLLPGPADTRPGLYVRLSNGARSSITRFTDAITQAGSRSLGPSEGPHANRHVRVVNQQDATTFLRNNPDLCGPFQELLDAIRRCILTADPSHDSASARRGIPTYTVRIPTTTNIILYPGNTTADAQPRLRPVSFFQRIPVDAVLVALADYQAQGVGYLSFRQGDRFRVTGSNQVGREMPRYTGMIEDGSGRTSWLPMFWVLTVEVSTESQVGHASPRRYHVNLPLWAWFTWN